MILEVNKFKRESASHGSRVPFALLPFEHRSIKLLKKIIIDCFCYTMFISGILRIPDFCSCVTKLSFHSISLRF